MLSQCSQFNSCSLSRQNQQLDRTLARTRNNNILPPRPSSVHHTRYTQSQHGQFEIQGQYKRRGAGEGGSTRSSYRCPRKNREATVKGLIECQCMLTRRHSKVASKSSSLTDCIKSPGPCTLTKGRQEERKETRQT